MTITQLQAEIRSKFSKLNHAGYIDDISIYKWALEALKKFGTNIAELQETVVEVDSTYGKLPDNFCSLYVAYKCDPVGYHCKGEPVLQNSIMWTERVERSCKWQSCDPCCVEAEEKIIKESLYCNDIKVDFYYNNPIPLKLGKRFRKNNIHKKCRNLIVRDCPYEINIVGKTLQANFDEGDVYMQYYGLPTDGNGIVLIPDTGRGELELYVEYYVTLRLFEEVMINNPDPNIVRMFEYYVAKEQQHKSLALTDTKFSTLTPRSFKRLRKINRAEMLKYECMFPEW